MLIYLASFNIPEILINQYGLGIFLEKNVNIKTSIKIALLSLLVGCASIPPEAPELSSELGKKISAIENANITLLNRFFDQKRAEVDKFIEEEWLPTFSKEFFSNRAISKAWNTIVSENDTQQRLTFIIKTAPKLQQKINEKRLELIQPLDILERKIEKGIRDEYSQAKAINNSITSFLLSVAEVSENRNRYLEKVGITDIKVGNLIDKTDEAVSNLLNKSKTAQDKTDRATKFLEKLKSLKDSI